MALTDGSKARVVYIVDDDEAVRNSTFWLLKAAGIAAVGFPGAGAFLEVFDPDAAGCILLDLHMPGMSGLELLELMQSRGIKTPVIVISGRSDPLFDDLIIRAGAMAILRKPSSHQELLALVRQAFSLNGTYIRPPASQPPE